MIAAITARRQQAAPVPRRDPIGFALFYRMDWCEKHPGMMFTGLGLMIVLASVLEKVLP